MNTRREFQFRVKNIASQPTKQPHPKQNYIHVPKQRCDLANKLPKQDASNLNHSYPTNEGPRMELQWVIRPETTTGERIIRLNLIFLSK